MALKHKISSLNRFFNHPIGRSKMPSISPPVFVRPVPVYNRNVIEKIGKSSHSLVIFDIKTLHDHVEKSGARIRFFPINPIKDRLSEKNDSLYNKIYEIVTQCLRKC